MKIDIVKCYSYEECLITYKNNITRNKIDKICKELKINKKIFMNVLNEFDKSEYVINDNNLFLSNDIIFDFINKLSKYCNCERVYYNIYKIDGYRISIDNIIINLKNFFKFINKDAKEYIYETFKLNGFKNPYIFKISNRHSLMNDNIVQDYFFIYKKELNKFINLLDEEMKESMKNYMILEKLQN